MIEKLNRGLSFFDSYSFSKYIYAHLFLFLTLSFLLRPSSMFKLPKVAHGGAIPTFPLPSRHDTFGKKTLNMLLAGHQSQPANKRPPLSPRQLQNKLDSMRNMHSLLENTITSNSKKNIQDWEQPSLVKVLREVEKRHNVTIVLAAEVGNREWSTASAHSKLKLRFVYMRNNWREYTAKTLPQLAATYTSLDDLRDTLEVTSPSIPASSSIIGYDLTKALTCAARMEPEMLELLYSSRIYNNINGDNDQYVAHLRLLVEKQQRLSILMSRYSRIAFECIESERNERDVSIRQYFKATRSLLMLEWLMLKHLMPPRNASKPVKLVETNMDTVLADLREHLGEELHDACVQVLTAKRTMRSKYGKMERIDALDAWMSGIFEAGSFYKYEDRGAEVDDDEALLDFARFFLVKLKLAATAAAASLNN